ncbi:MAG TPA: hypothetical protein VN364_05200 [Bellilinea sp.]|nr:hypothetical protein [Bellilinea sp.]
MNAILSVGTLFILAYRLPAGVLQQVKTGIPWWFWGLMVLTLGLLVWMLFTRPKEEDRDEKAEKYQEIQIPMSSGKSSSAFDLEDDDVDFGPYADRIGETESPAANPPPFVESVDEEIPIQPDFDTSYLAPDDLTIIEGIGQKIAKILAQADIHTYAQLANTDSEKLLVVLASAGIFMTDPTTWPDQARFAAEGKWDELKKLQESLQGGRQVN